jgi:hypothetical protein
VRAERKPGETETSVKLHLPAATATLVLTPTSPGTSSGTPQDRAGSYAQLQTKDESVQSHVAFEGAEPKTIKLPPGTYHIMNPMTMRPREDIEPIVLKAGELRTINYTPPPAAGAAGAAASAASRISTQICYWTSDGVLVTAAQPKLLDAAGKPQESGGYGGVGAIFIVPPGKYKAVLERPGKEPHVKEIAVGVAGTSDVDETGGGRFSPVHIVLD